MLAATHDDWTVDMFSIAELANGKSTLLKAAMHALNNFQPAADRALTCKEPWA